MHKGKEKISDFFVKPLAIRRGLWYSTDKKSKGVSPMGYMELIAHRKGSAPV